MNGKISGGYKENTRKKKGWYNLKTLKGEKRTGSGRSNNLSQPKRGKENLGG